MSPRVIPPLVSLLEALLRQATGGVALGIVCHACGSPELLGLTVSKGADATIRIRECRRCGVRHETVEMVVGTTRRHDIRVPYPPLHRRPYRRKLSKEHPNKLG